MKCCLPSIFRRGRSGLRAVPGEFFLVLVGIEPEVAFETTCWARGPEGRAASREVDLDVPFWLRVRHLGRHGALPNEAVQLEIGRVEEVLDVFRAAVGLGRTDGLVRFLRAFGLGLVFARFGWAKFARARQKSLPTTALASCRNLSDRLTESVRMGDETDLASAPSSMPS